MGKLLEFATGLKSERSLWSRLGRWIIEVSKTTDANAATIAGSGISGSGSTNFLTQSTFTVNPQTGSDTNDGTASAPLQSLSELSRRLSGQTFAPTVTSVTIGLSGTFNPTDSLVLADAVFTGPTVVTVQGTMSTFASGSITAFTVMSPATAVRAALTDAAQDFTSSLRKRIRITSGAASGALSWVCSTAAATIANVGQFWIDNALGGASIDPLIGNTYVVENYTTILQRYFINLQGPVTVELRDIQFQAIVPATDITTSSFEPDVDRLKHKVFGCLFTMSGFATHIVSGNTTFMAVAALWDTNNGSGFQFKHGVFSENGCCWFALTQVIDGGFVSGQRNMHDGNGTLHVGRLAQNASYNKDFDHRGFFGNINGTITSHMRSEDGAQIIFSAGAARFWGAAGNTVTNSLVVRNSAGFVYVTLPTATGVVPGNDVVLAAGAAQAWATLPAIAASPDNAYANVRH